ncbi:MAG TPA: alanine racemase [Acetobacteraceae bacterium]|nr:alanine racemase [Acetobacteraceae bacterium]
MGEGVAARLEIDLDAIAANWRFLRDRHPSGAVAGVVKADGYGLGARQVAARLYREGCRHFFVAHFAEARAIRDLLPDAMLAVLNGLIPGTEAEYTATGILPVLGSLAEVGAWSAAARRLGRKLPGLLHVDTGMSRLGLDPRELAILQADHARLDGIDLQYVMTHLVSSEIPDDPINQRQRRRFADARAGLPPVPSSLANSSGIFLGEDFASDLARPGAALYGINPTPGRPNPMRPVVRLLARVLQVRDVAMGETVGYNATWRVPGPSRIATVGVGYADGWHRSHSGRGAAFFDGRPVPLVGRVSMDLTTYDVTARPEIGVGTPLELIGPSVPPDQVAEAAGTNGYEVLTSLGRRFARAYRGA